MSQKTIAYAVNCNGTTDTEQQKEFKEQYSNAYNKYAMLCRIKKVIIGKPLVLSDKESQILLLPIYDNEAKIEAVRECIKYIKQWHNDMEIERIVFRKFDEDIWNETTELIRKELTEIPIEIE